MCVCVFVHVHLCVYVQLMRVISAIFIYASGEIIKHVNKYIMWNTECLLYNFHIKLGAKKQQLK